MPGLKNLTLQFLNGGQFFEEIPAIKMWLFVVEFVVEVGVLDLIGRSTFFWDGFAFVIQIQYLLILLQIF